MVHVFVVGSYSTVPCIVHINHIYYIHGVLLLFVRIQIQFLHFSYTVVMDNNDQDILIRDTLDKLGSLYQDSLSVQRRGGSGSRSGLFNAFQRERRKAEENSGTRIEAQNVVDEKGFLTVINDNLCTLTDAEAKSLCEAFAYGDEKNSVDFARFIGMLLLPTSVPPPLPPHIDTMVDRSNKDEANEDDQYFYDMDTSGGARVFRTLKPNVVSEDENVSIGSDSKWEQDLRKNALSPKEKVAFGAHASFRATRQPLTLSPKKLELVKSKLRQHAYNGTEGFSILREFESFDSNHDGTLSYQEFATAIRRLVAMSDGEIVLLIRAFDKDLDGKIDYCEFAQYVEGSEKDVTREVHRRLSSIAEERKRSSSPILDVGSSSNVNSSTKRKQKKTKKKGEDNASPPGYMRPTSFSALKMKAKARTKASGSKKMSSASKNRTSMPRHLRTKGTTPQYMKATTNWRRDHAKRFQYRSFARSAGKFTQTFRRPLLTPAQKKAFLGNPSISSTRTPQKLSRKKLMTIKNKLRAHAYVGTGGYDLTREFEIFEKECRGHRTKGRLSHEEFGRVIRRLVPLSDGEMRCLLEVFDRDDNGFVDFVEFSRFVGSEPKDSSAFRKKRQMDEEAAERQRPKMTPAAILRRITGEKIAGPTPPNSHKKGGKKKKRSAKSPKTKIPSLLSFNRLVVRCVDSTSRPVDVVSAEEKSVEAPSVSVDCEKNKITLASCDDGDIVEDDDKKTPETFTFGTSVQVMDSNATQSIIFASTMKKIMTEIDTLREDYFAENAPSHAIFVLGASSARFTLFGPDIGDLEDGDEGSLTRAGSQIGLVPRVIHLLISRQPSDETEVVKESPSLNGAEHSSELYAPMPLGVTPSSGPPGHFDEPPSPTPRPSVHPISSSKIANEIADWATKDGTHNAATTSTAISRSNDCIATVSYLGLSSGGNVVDLFKNAEDENESVAHTNDEISTWEIRSTDEVLVLLEHAERARRDADCVCVVFTIVVPKSKNKRLVFCGIEPRAIDTALKIFLHTGRCPSTSPVQTRLLCEVLTKCLWSDEEISKDLQKKVLPAICIATVAARTGDFQAASHVLEAVAVLDPLSDELEDDASVEATRVNKEGGSSPTLSGWPSAARKVHHSSFSSVSLAASAGGFVRAEEPARAEEQFSNVAKSLFDNCPGGEKPHGRFHSETKSDRGTARSSSGDLDTKKKHDRNLWSPNVVSSAERAPNSLLRMLDEESEKRQKAESVLINLTYTGINEILRQRLQEELDSKRDGELRLRKRMQEEAMAQRKVEDVLRMRLRDETRARIAVEEKLRQRLLEEGGLMHDKDAARQKSEAHLREELRLEKKHRQEIEATLREKLRAENESARKSKTDLESAKRSKQASILDLRRERDARSSAESKLAKLEKENERLKADVESKKGQISELLQIIGEEAEEDEVRGESGEADRFDDAPPPGLH